MYTGIMVAERIRDPPCAQKVPPSNPRCGRVFFSIGQIAWSPCERIERLSAFLAYRFNPVSVYCDWA